MSNATNSAGRDAWNSKLGFIPVCVDSAVGTGNIWIFLYRMATYSDSFLLLYLIFDVVIGFSGVVGEMSFDHAARSGPVGAFGAACASRGENKRKLGQLIGAIPMLGALMLAIGYSVVIGWIFKYTAGSITGSVFAPSHAAGASEGYKWMFTIRPEAFKDPMLYVFALGQSFFSLSLAGNRSRDGNPTGQSAFQSHKGSYHHRRHQLITIHYRSYFPLFKIPTT